MYWKELDEEEEDIERMLPMLCTCGRGEQCKWHELLEMEPLHVVARLMNEELAQQHYEWCLAHGIITED